MVLNSRGVTESVCLEDCNDSITNHLNTCHLSRETLTESQLILARAGIFDFPMSKLSETMIRPKHRHTLGKYWKQRRPCQYPTHKGDKKAVKTRDVVNVAMEKELYLMGLDLFRAILSSNDVKYIFRCDRGKLYIKRRSSAG